MANSQIHSSEEKTHKLAKNVFTDSLSLKAKYKEDPQSQFTSLFLRTYASTEEVERLVEVLNPDEYAYIVHDRDKHANGAAKETHIHLLMYRKVPMRLTKIFTFSEANTMVQIPRSRKYCYEYLTHKNDPDKVSYSPDEIHEYHKGTNTFAATSQEQREQRNLSLLDDIGTLSRRQMAEKYGSDYIKNYQRYESFMEVVKIEDRLAECDKLSSEAKPDEEFYTTIDASGDELRLTLADFVCVQLREMMEGFTMPTANEIVKMYHQVLNKARLMRREYAYAMRCREENVEVGDL